MTNGDPREIIAVRQSICLPAALASHTSLATASAMRGGADPFHWHRLMNDSSWSCRAGGASHAMIWGEYEKGRREDGIWLADSQAMATPGRSRSRSGCAGWH